MYILFVLFMIGMSSIYAVEEQGAIELFLSNSKAFFSCEARGPEAFCESMKKDWKQKEVGQKKDIFEKFTVLLGKVTVEISDESDKKKRLKISGWNDKGWVVVEDLLGKIKFSTKEQDGVNDGSLAEENDQQKEMNLRIGDKVTLGYLQQGMMGIIEVTFDEKIKLSTKNGLLSTCLSRWQESQVISGAMGDDWREKNEGTIILEGMAIKQLKELDDFLKSDEAEREKFFLELPIVDHVELLVTLHSLGFIKEFNCNYFNYFLKILIKELQNGNIYCYEGLFCHLLQFLKQGKLSLPIDELIKKKYIESNHYELKLPPQTEEVCFIEEGKILLKSHDSTVRLYDLEEERVLYKKKCPKYLIDPEIDFIEGIGYLVKYGDDYLEFFDCTDPNDIRSFNFCELKEDFSGIKPIKNSKRYIAIKLGCFESYKLFDFKTKKFVSEELATVKEFVSFGEDHIAVLLKDSDSLLVLNVKNGTCGSVPNCEKTVYLGQHHAAVKLKGEHKYRIIDFSDLKKIITLDIEFDIECNQSILSTKRSPEFIWLGNEIVAIKKLTGVVEDGIGYKLFNFKTRGHICNLKNVRDIVPLVEKDGILVRYDDDRHSIKFFNLNAKGLDFDGEWERSNQIRVFGNKILSGDDFLIDLGNNDIFKELNLTQVLFVTTVIRNRNDAKVVDSFIRRHLEVWKSIAPEIRQELFREDKLGHQILQGVEKLIRELLINKHIERKEEKIKIKSKQNLDQSFWSKKVALVGCIFLWICAFRGLFEFLKDCNCLNVFHKRIPS